VICVFLCFVSQITIFYSRKLINLTPCGFSLPPSQSLLAKMQQQQNIVSVMDDSEMARPKQHVFGVFLQTFQKPHRVDRCIRLGGIS
jgi:hypothetical protein